MGDRGASGPDCGGSIQRRHSQIFLIGTNGAVLKTCNRGASSASKTLNIIKIVCNWECTLYLQPGDLMKFFGISSIIQYESSVKYK